MHFSDIIGKLGSNDIWRYFWFLQWQKFDLQPLATLLNFFRLVCKLCKSGLQTITFWKCLYKHCLYWKIFSTDIYRKIEAATVCCFFSNICWSVNCMTWVSKFNNFFLICTETEVRFIFEGFNIVLYEKFISDSPILFLLFLSGLQIV